MKKPRTLLLRCGLLCLAAGLLLPALVVAMDADELINKHLAAMGGKERLKAVKSQKATGKFMVQGMEIPFTMSQKRPNLLRIDAEVMGMQMIQCYDGKQGWSINPMTGSTDAQIMGEMEQKSFKLQSDMDGVLMDHAAKGYAVEYLGEEDVEGTPAHKLRLDTGEDIVIDFFFDKEYFLVIKQASKVTVDGNEFASETYPSDYKDVNGMVAPFSIETRQGDVVMNQIMMESLEHDTAIDDAVFVMPPKAEAPAEEAKQ